MLEARRGRERRAEALQQRHELVVKRVISVSTALMYTSRPDQFESLLERAGFEVSSAISNLKPLADSLLRVAGATT